MTKLASKRVEAFETRIERKTPENYGNGSKRARRVKVRAKQLAQRHRTGNFE